MNCACRAGAIILAALSSACTPLTPAGAESVVPGARVRAYYATEHPPIEGTISRYVIGSLELSVNGAEIRRVSLGEVLTLEVRQEGTRWRYTGIGAGLGALGGMLVGMFCTKNCGISEDGDTRFLPLIGAGAGAAIGGLTGGLLVAPETWVPVDLQLMR